MNQWYRRNLHMFYDADYEHGIDIGSPVTQHVLLPIGKPVSEENERHFHKNVRVQ